MDFLRPKVDKSEKEMSCDDYDINKVLMDTNSLPLEEKIQWHTQT